MNRRRDDVASLTSSPERIPVLTMDDLTPEASLERNLDRENVAAFVGARESFEERDVRSENKVRKWQKTTHIKRPYSEFPLGYY